MYSLVQPLAFDPSRSISALPPDVSEALLGSASLSFYASRIVFCEGESAGLDEGLYGAWFAGPDTVVRPVGSAEMVIRCVDALRKSGVALSLEAIGIVDRDYYGDALLANLPAGVHPLPVHEVESLLALPAVVRAVASHLSRELDERAYLESLKVTVNEDQARAIVIQRWKAAVEPYLTGLLATTNKSSTSLDDLDAQLPGLFDMRTWPFSPREMLGVERQRVEAGRTSANASEFLAVVPGKQLAPVAARTVGMEINSYVELVTKALRQSDGGSLAALRDALIEALGAALPARAAPIALSSLETSAA